MTNSNDTTARAPMPKIRLAPNVACQVNAKYADIVPGSFGSQVRLKGTIDGQENAMLFLPSKLERQLQALHDGGLLESVPAIDAELAGPVELKLLQRNFTVVLEQKAGEKFGQLVITTPGTPAAPATAAVPTAAAVASPATLGDAVKSLPASQVYSQCLRFAIEYVVPEYESAGLTLDAATLSAITATLFIEKSRRESGR